MSALGVRQADPYCVFCGGERSQVALLIAANQAAICGECVSLAVTAWREAAASAPRRTPPPDHLGFTLAESTLRAPM